MAISLMIVDDHGVLRAGLRALLNTEADFKVVGEAATGEDALRQVDALAPQVVIMDISMPGLDGIETTRRLLDRFPKTRVLLLTIHEDSSLLREAIQAGASGYILKRAVESELINAIREVHLGGLYVHPSMTRSLLGPQVSKPKIEQPQAALTPREVDVLRFLARGYTNREVAGALGLSIRTIESHRANLMNKLNAQSRIDLVRYAVDNKLT